MIRKPTIQELISLAKENRDKIYNREVSDDLDEITRFILMFDIKDGKNKIFSDIVYKAYSVWSISPVSKTDFLEEFEGMFPSVKGDDRNYHLLNYKPAELVNAAQKTKVQCE